MYNDSEVDSQSDISLGSQDTINSDSIDKISEAQLYDWIDTNGNYINNCIDEDGLKCHQDSDVCEYCEKFWIAYCEWDEKINHFEFIVPDDQLVYEISQEDNKTAEDIISQQINNLHL